MLLCLLVGPPPASGAAAAPGHGVAGELPPAAPQNAPAAEAQLSVPVGSVEFKTLESKVLGRPVNYSVYLPPSYAGGASDYPVVFFLHGLGEDERRWGERGGKEILDRLIAEKKVGEVVLAIPDGGRGFYTNSYDGGQKWEDFLVQEFIPFIEGAYRIRPGPKWRALSGSSMGAYGAMKIGMKHPDMFSSVSAHGAVLIDRFPETVEPGTRQARYLEILEGPFGKPFHREYWESENPIRLAEHVEHFKNLKLYFDCGDRDRYGFDAGARVLHELLEKKGFPHEFAILPGDHGWEFLRKYGDRSLEFHWKNFGK
ncbi:MAG: hypothetical protein HYX74_05775 [Acidobacteria bacterium]|nr:hypothetical protein [Acidobacteriota bacterium]